MSKYEVIYDYDNGYDEEKDILEEFEGTYLDLQNFIKYLKKSGAYHINATSIEI